MPLRLEGTGPGDARPDNPTSDPAAAAQVFAELRGAEPVSALNELTQWLDELNAAAPSGEDKRSEILGRLQESGEPHVAALFGQCSRKAGADARARDAAWRAIDTHLAALGSAMVASTRAMLKEAAARPALQAAAAAGVARLLRTCRLQLKSHLLRYRAAPPNLWRTAYAVHRAAEVLHCDAIEVRAQTSHHVPTTVTQELLRLMMLQAAAPERMAPGEIEVADWAVEHVGAHFALSPRGAQEGLFCFDPASDEPPRLATSPASGNAAVRYFEAGAGRDALAHICSDLRLGKRLDIKKEVAPHWQLAALEHLLTTWNSHPAAGPAPRSAVQAQLAAVYGFGQVWQQLSRVQSEGAMELVDGDDEPQRAPETWVLREAAGDELGVEIPPGAAQGVCCGDLVAVSSRPGEWAVALVRALQAQSQATQVDLLVLASQPQAVHLRMVIPEGEQKAFSNESARVFGFNGVRALGLAGSDDGARGADFLLPSRHWKEGRIFQAAEQARYLRPVRTVQTGDDYVHVEFRWAHEPD